MKSETFPRRPIATCAEVAAKRPHAVRARAAPPPLAVRAHVAPPPLTFRAHVAPPPLAVLIIQSIIALLDSPIPALLMDLVRQVFV